MYRPSSINDASGTTLTYTLEVYKSDASGYASIGTYTSNAASNTQTITMAALKTASGYTATDNGA